MDNNPIYAQEDNSSDNADPAPALASAAAAEVLPPQEVINPSKSKYDKFVEDVKQRESLSKPNFQKIALDPHCELQEAVRVYADYSVCLIH